MEHTRDDEPQYFALGVYELGNSRVQVSVDSGPQGWVNLDVRIRDGASDASGRGNTVAETRQGVGRVRHFNL
jgi:hypothetical protein